MKTTQETFGTPEEALWLYKFSGTRKASWEEIVEVPKLTFSVPIISNAARKDNISSFFLEACWHKCTPVSFYIFNLNNSSRRGRMKHREKTAGKHHGKEGRGGARIGKNQLNSREKRKEKKLKDLFQVRSPSILHHCLSRHNWVMCCLVLKIYRPFLHEQSCFWSISESYLENLWCSQQFVWIHKMKARGQKGDLNKLNVTRQICFSGG